MRLGMKAVARKATAGPDVYSVYAEFAGPMYWYALSLLGRAEEAEDVVHDVFVALLRRRGGEDLRYPRAYLLTAVRRHVLTRRRRRPEAALPEESPLSWVEVAGDWEQAIDVDRAVRELPEEQREVVTLKVLGELTFREIAKVVGIPENTAQSRYRRALEKLRERSGRDDDV